MSDEVYNKQAVDKMMQGIIQIQSHMMIGIMEPRIANGESSRDDVIALMAKMASVTSNPVTQAFYEAMGSAFAEPSSPEKFRDVGLRVIPGGKG